MRKAERHGTGGGRGAARTGAPVHGAAEVFAGRVGVPEGRAVTVPSCAAPGSARSTVFTAMVPTPHDPRHPAIVRHLRSLVGGAVPAQVRVYEDSHLAVIAHPRRYYSISFLPMVGEESYFVLAVDTRSVRYPEMWGTRGEAVEIVDAPPGRTLADLVYAYIAANPA